MSLEDLKPTGGEAYCHLFENALTDVDRGVFWSFYVSLEPVVDEEESWSTAILVEWLTWPIRDWKHLDRCSLANVEREDFPEASFYLCEHQPFQVEELWFSDIRGDELTMHLIGTFCIEDPDGVIHGPFTRSIESTIRFIGAIVVPESLSTKPVTVEAVIRELDTFLDTSTFEPPRWDRFRYVFPPRLE